MSYRTVFSDRAQRELADSWKWYEERKYGLGDRFTEAVLKIILQLEHDPEKGLLRNVIFREAIVKTFHFLLFTELTKQIKPSLFTPFFILAETLKESIRGKSAQPPLPTLLQVKTSGQSIWLRLYSTGVWIERVGEGSVKLLNPEMAEWLN
jgi:hypothetical protein